MRKTTLIILFAIIALSAYARHKHSKKQKTTGGIQSVSVRHTGCYGHCPEYITEVKADGNVVYKALRAVPDTGIFTKYIGLQKTMKIIDGFNTYKVDTCNNTYPKRIPDIPRIILIVKYKDSAKTISDVNFGPSYLKQLCKSVDVIGATKDSTWQKKVITIKN